MHCKVALDPKETGKGIKAYDRVDVQNDRGKRSSFV